MTLLELKEAVDHAIEKAAEYGESPSEIVVSLQIDRTNGEGSVFTDREVELSYDGNGQASGCVLVGWAELAV